VFGFGAILLAAFPSTDLSGSKSRPRMIVSRDNNRRKDVVVCFIASVPRTNPDIAVLEPLPGTGLRVRSVVRFVKLATLEKSLLLGRMGDACPDWLAAPKATFFGVFGFDP
jgi:mRNA interferase MazF